MTRFMAWVLILGAPVAVCLGVSEMFRVRARAVKVAEARATEAQAQHTACKRAFESLIQTHDATLKAHEAEVRELTQRAERCDATPLPCTKPTEDVLTFLDPALMAKVIKEEQRDRARILRKIGFKEEE